MGTLSLAQPVTQTLPPRTVGPSDVRLPATREPVLPPGLFQGREGPRRPAQVDPRSALGSRGPSGQSTRPFQPRGSRPGLTVCLGPEQPGPPLSTRPHEAALVASAPPTLLVRTLPPTDAENGF